MPPKSTSQARGGARGGRPRGGKSRPSADAEPESSNPFASSDNEEEEEEPTTAPAEEEEEQQPDKTIPRDLLTRLLHEFFAKDATRISRDANAAVGKYVDVFVREAIARTAVEKRGGFLEVSSRPAWRFEGRDTDGVVRWRIWRRSHHNCCSTFELCEALAPIEIQPIEALWIIRLGV